MGATVVHYVQPHHEVIEWGAISLTGVSTEILWDTYGRCPSGAAKSAIRRELSNRGEI